MHARRLATVVVLAGASMSAVLASTSESVRNAGGFVWARLRGGYTVEERVADLVPQVAPRLSAAFAAAGLSYPAAELTLVAFKDTRRLDLFARAAAQTPWVLVRSYAVEGASGGAGPKLLRGDGQVPEGIYAIEALNPNSRFHLALRLNFPNAFDRRVAAQDGRSDLGSDIMIHGGASSVGCLAVGNAAIEELFVLTALVQPEHVRVVIAPTDPRRADLVRRPDQPAWVGELYGTLQTALTDLPSAR